MRKIFVLILFGLSFFALSSCRSKGKVQSWFDPNDKMKVLSTTAMIDDLVKRVGGKYVDATPLIQGELDPHSYELVKGDAEKFQFAGIIFHNGLGLEHGASLKYQLVQNKKAIALGDVIDQADLIEVDGVIDPHIWMDAKIFAKLCEPIAYHLGQLDPNHRSHYYKNAKELREKILNAHFEVQNLLKEVKNRHRYLVTTHDAFRYFVRAYLATDAEKKDGSWQTRLASPEGFAPEGQISPVDIERIIHFATKNEVSVIFAESNLSKNALNKVVDVVGQKGKMIEIAPDALYGDVMYRSYLETLLYNANVLKTALNGS